MSVFISHSFKDDAKFDDLCFALKSENVPYWLPSEMRAGLSLREQLRKSIDNCELCIFIATKNSVKSQWCSAELGAFWGARKKVIVYVADDELTDDDIPKQFKGDIWYRKIRETVQDAKEIIHESQKKDIERNIKNSASSKIGEISVGAFIDLMRTVIESSDSETFIGKMDKISQLIDLYSKENNSLENDKERQDRSAIFEPILKSIAGESIESIKFYGKKKWKTFNINSSTGTWLAFVKSQGFAAGGDVEVNTGCLLLYVKEDVINTIKVAETIVEIHIESKPRYEISEVTSHGAMQLGQIKSFESFNIASN